MNKQHYVVYRNWGHGINVLGVTDSIDTSVDLLQHECQMMDYTFELRPDDAWPITECGDDVIYNCFDSRGYVRSVCIIHQININDYLGIEAEG